MTEVKVDRCRRYALPESAPHASHPFSIALLCNRHKAEEGPLTMTE